MIWIYLAIVSAVFLGIYDILKKTSLNQNAVIPVLFISTLAGSLPWIPLILLSVWNPALLQGSLFFIPAADFHVHALIFLKSLIVICSWLFVYFGVKHLPISIASPIRASAPLWTLIGALCIFMERPSLGQWIGIGAILGGYFFLSLAGRAEGIVFHRNRWIVCMAIGTIIGSVSALYDKYLLSLYPAALVQTWFSFYMVIILIPVLFLWFPTRHRTTPFQWRWTIPLIGLCLALADFLYFQALRDSHALISVISAIRRSNAIISFAWGASVLQEANRQRKALCLAAILAGILLIAFAPK